ncbi:succinate dehydrogenase/fumarate reductase iron-sulfur subunit [Marinobacter panjinensis]|nr:succinate dehydrogenase/fumarate reductase iron-sulfur subunit [Marinobacter panjinensis]MCR8915018.1 succinate dehydrogenase/fumarate reductase iron-sulfur subunit [Marinobacter panjinensis]
MTDTTTNHKTDTASSKNDDRMTLEILRYIPGTHSEPTFQRFDIPYVEDWSILDALGYIKDELDSSLAYRWSCRMAVCGSCGMMFNGVPKLACETFIRDYYPRAIRVEPLENFGIERDLVIDQEPFLEKLESVKPYIIDAMANAPSGKPGAPASHERETIQAGENKQTPKELAMFDQYSMCINCLLCYSACPQFGLNPAFLGPATISLAHRYNQDNRDHGTADRAPALNEKDGVWSCTFVGYCSEVCPKSVDPASAIQQEKVRGATDWALSWILPKGAR